MPRKATKAKDNVFYQARMEAASFNDLFNSRDGAAAKLGIDRTRLSRIELDLLPPYPEEVALLADGYNAPELEPYFCAKVCPLQRGQAPTMKTLSLDRIGINAMAALKNADAVQQKLLDVIQDGKITPDELPQIEEIMAFLKGASQAYEMMKVWLEKYLK